MLFVRDAGSGTGFIAIDLLSLRKHCNRYKRVHTIDILTPSETKVETKTKTIRQHGNGNVEYVEYIHPYEGLIRTFFFRPSAQFGLSSV